MTKFYKFSLLLIVMYNKKMKSQGEIFGIALMFVVIIIGIIIYGQIKVLNPNNENDLKTDGKYSILAEGSLNSILKMSTGCEIERNKDRVLDLVNFCIENSYSSDNDPEVYCSDGISYPSCSHVLEILNSSLYGFFNSSLIGPMLFKLRIELPAEKNNILNTNLSNFGSFEYNGKIVNETGKNSYIKLKFKKAPSGIRSLDTAKREITFNLALYYQ